MNKQRRAKINAALEQLSVIRSLIEELRDEEQDAFDNMPEGLQSSEKGERAEEAASYLDDAVTGFDDIESALNEAIER
jgi:hypothetical protein